MALIDKIYGYPILNVSNSVGNAAANYWTDIMLVQYLIRRVYEWDTMSPAPQLGADGLQIYLLPDPNQDYMNLDKTGVWIGNFQSKMNELGYSHSSVDNRVDRAKEAAHVFTISHLNNFYRYFVTIWGGHKDISTFALGDPTMPPLLKNQLSNGNH